jgi:hypothetical protein
MKPWRIGIALALLASPGVKADLVVVQKVEQSGPPRQSMDVTLKIKGDKIRADIGSEISVIMDTASGATITLRHPEKTALEVSGEAARQLMEKMNHLRQASDETAEIPPSRIEATGQRETIAGRETRGFSTQTGAVRITWWIAPKLDGPDPFAEAFEALQKTAMVQLAGGMAGPSGGFQLPGLPLKTEMITPDGRKITTTVISVKEQPLEAIDFTTPPGYRSLAGPLFGPSLPLSAP